MVESEQETYDILKGIALSVSKTGITAKVNVTDILTNDEIDNILV